jgi:hypothetical protein
MVSSEVGHDAVAGAQRRTDLPVHRGDAGPHDEAPGTGWLTPGPVVVIHQLGRAAVEVFWRRLAWLLAGGAVVTELAGAIARLIEILGRIDAEPTRIGGLAVVPVDRGPGPAWPPLQARRRGPGDCADRSIGCIRLLPGLFRSRP